MLTFLVLLVAQTTPTVKPLDSYWSASSCLTANTVPNAPYTLAWDPLPSPQDLVQSNGKTTTWTLVDYELYITVLTPGNMRTFTPRTSTTEYVFTTPEAGQLCFSVMGRGTYLYLP